MFIPNSRGILYPLIGMNGDGEPLYGNGQTVRCAVAMLNSVVKKTSVRADSSGSRGASEETSLASEIMFPANVTPKIDDKFAVAGFKMHVTQVSPCYNVAGQLDHYEAQLVTLVGQ
jgi:hypothetical protein